ncbi:MAG: hypothetical protein D6706_15345, partial [Chloroflexi bacterium]
IGEYSLPVFSGENEDIFVCQWPVTGSATSCTYAPNLVLDGTAIGLDTYKVDAIHVVESPQQ